MPYTDAEQTAFLDEAAGALHDILGVRMNTSGPKNRENRVASFVPRVKVGVVALDKGSIRVHVHSYSVKHQAQMRAIEAQWTGRSPSAELTGVPLVARPGEDSAELLYLEFSWQAHGPLALNLPRVREAANFFKSVRGLLRVDTRRKKNAP